MFLNRAGYRTLRAASGDQALEVFTDEVDAVLTDCAMPGLSGDKLAMLLGKFRAGP
jgi:CheY-like chemotaxis protein